MPDRNFSDFIVYVDESGDHSLVKINPEYPVFVLAFCIFRKSVYAHEIVPKIKELKFKYFGHDMVVLHEHEIRKEKNAFNVLRNQEIREPFLGDLSRLIDQASFTIIATVIRKDALVKRYKSPEHPYHLALQFCLERTHHFIKSNGEDGGTTHIIFENRGAKEDAELELEFRRICDGGNYRGEELPFKIVFADKKTNSGGLQLADMVARPIGVNCIRPGQANRAYDILEGKFDRNARGVFQGLGLKSFP